MEGARRGGWALDAGGISTLLEVDPDASLLFVAIPAGMAASYLGILVALVRSRDSFVTPA